MAKALIILVTIIITVTATHLWASSSKEAKPQRWHIEESVTVRATKMDDKKQYQLTLPVGCVIEVDSIKSGSDEKIVAYKK